jgi:hypothetical protein
VVLTSAGEYYLKLMVSVLNKERTTTKTKFQSLPLINKWQALLNIPNWKINCESISENQVVDELEGNTSGHEFVGIQIDFKNQIGTIYHTRKLNEDDIIHELIHVKHPSWSEDKVNFWTSLLEKKY